MKRHGIKVLVTGGTGFIGTVVVRQLVRRGFRTRVLSRHLRPHAVDHGPVCETVPGDIRDRGAVRRAMSGVTHVCHLAAAVDAFTPDRQYLYDVNVGGTANIAEAAMYEGVETIVHVSSISAIEFAGGGVADERSIIRRTRHLTEYGLSKARAELEIERWLAHGLRAVIGYPTRVFGIGPLEDCNAATKVLDLYLHGRLRILPGGGRSANGVSVNDVARGIVLALLRGTPGQRYILGGENATLHEFLQRAASLAGCVLHPVPVPVAVGALISMLEEVRSKVQCDRAWITKAWYDVITEHTPLSCAKARNELGYSITPLDHTLAGVVRWLMSARGENRTGRPL